MRRSRSQLNRVSSNADQAYGSQDQMSGFANNHEAYEIQRRLNAMGNQFAVHPPYYDDPMQSSGMQNNMQHMMPNQAYQQPFPNGQMMQPPMHQQQMHQPHMQQAAMPSAQMPTMQAAPHFQPHQVAPVQPQPASTMPPMAHEAYTGSVAQAPRAPEANTQQIDTIKAALEQMSNKLHAINNSNAARGASESSFMQQSEVLKQSQTQILQEIHELKTAIAATPAADTSSNDLEIIRETLNANYRAIMEHLERSPQNTMDTTIFNNALEANRSEISSQLNELKASIDTTLSNPEIYARTLEVSHEDITKRLDDMNNALQTTVAQPELYLETFENNNRELSEKISQLQNSILEMETASGSSSEMDLSSIEMRLEEITRAVVALSLNDNSANNLERIEARVSDLTKTLNNFSIPDNTNTQAFEKLENRLNDISSLMSAGSPDIDGLASQINILSEKFENLSALSVSGSENSTDDSALLNRMDKLVEQISLNQTQDAGHGSSAEILKQLETLTTAIDQLAVPSSTENNDDKFSSIEQQLLAITRQLNEEAPASGEISFDPLFERLSGIEEQIGSSRDITIELATKAAEDAVKMSMQANSQFAGSSDDVNPAVLGSMSQALENLNKHAQEASSQNIEAFGAVSETLGLMVERLGKIETGLAGRIEQNVPARNFAPAEAFDEGNNFESNQPEAESPLEASFQDNQETVQHDNEPETKQEKTNPVENLVRQARLERGTNVPVSSENELEIDNVVPESTTMVEEKPAAFAPVMPQAEAPSIAMDAIPEAREPERPMNLQDTAIEPGTGGPDLAALVQQANERRKNQKGTDADTGGSDFIAAARRAAQAAAQEAGEIEEEIEESKSNNLLASLPELFARRKKAILIGAAAVLFAAIALPLVGKLFGSDEQQVASTAPPPAIEQVDNSVQATTNAPVAAIAPQAGIIQDQTTEQTNEQQDDASGLSAQPDVVTPKDNLNVASLNESENPEPTSFINIEGINFASDALKDAVQKGEPAALFEIGKRYTDGTGVEKDLAKAAEWYELAANKGFAPAQYIIGNFNEKGFGVDKNPAEAAKWYEEAAKGGNIIAMHNLAVLNATPNALSAEPDMNAAFRWFVNAADYGVRDSQVNAGIFYTKGFGTEVNLVEAYKWFAVAAKAGDKDAGNKRDVIANAMPPSELEIAKALVKDWQPLDVVKAANEVTVNDAWKSAVTPAASLKIDRNMIAQTQVLLKRAGFNAGVADGIMGQNTTNAILAFQQKVGLPANGKIDMPLLRALQSFGA